MVSADNLNYDVLSLIFSFLASSDLVSVCLVSQSFRASGFPSLYRKIYCRVKQAKAWPQVQSPFTTILAHPQLAHSVRRCEINSIPMLKNQPHPSFVISCEKSLVLCHNLLAFTCTTTAAPFLQLLSSKASLVELKLVAPLNTSQTANLTKLAGLHSLTLLEPSLSVCIALMKWLPSMAKSLTSVTIVNSRDFNRAVLDVIAKSLPQLHGLHITGCSNISHQYIVSLFPLLEQLESLSITTWEHATSPERVIGPAGVYLNNLQHFSIDARNTISPDTIPALFVNLFKTITSSPLKSITIRLSERMLMAEAFVCQVAADFQRTLHRLNLINASLSSSALRVICRLCSNLEQLSLSLPRSELEMSQFTAAFEHATKLRVLIDLGATHLFHSHSNSLSTSSIKDIFRHTKMLDKIISGNRCWTCDRKQSNKTRCRKNSYMKRKERVGSDENLHIKLERLRLSRNPAQYLDVIFDYSSMAIFILSDRALPYSTSAVTDSALVPQASILEPQPSLHFIPFLMKFVYLPTEILEEVVEQVERPRDLLSLALSSKLLRDIVVPHHIQFRDISCDIHRSTLWKSLEENPRLAAKIRSLDLYAEPLRTRSDQVPLRRHPIFPRSLGESEKKNRVYAASMDSLHALKQAVMHMKGLRKFTWEHQRLGYDLGAAGWKSRQRNVMLLVRDIFDVIVESCPLLKEVDIRLRHESLLSGQGDVGAVSISLPLGKLSGLDRFSVTNINHSTRYHLFNNVTLGLNSVNPHGSRHHILDLITERCPNLVDLKLKVAWDVLWNLTDLLTNGHWPRLRRLTLDGLYKGALLRSDPDEKVLLTASFLKRHPQLERLSLMTQGVLIGNCIENTLPRLRSFRYDNRDQYVGTHELVIPSSLLEGLEYFSPYELYGEYPIEPSRTSMRAFASRISDEHLPLVVKMFPNLERLQLLGLHVNNSEENHTRMRRMGENDTRTEILSKLRRLTHLAGFLICAHHSPDTPEALQSRIRELGVLPSLHYVNYEIRSYTEVEVKWICIDRDEAGSYIGFRYIKALPDMDPERWGGFFESLSS